MSVKASLYPAALDNWINIDKGFLVIAGPCSVESRNQLFLTATEIAAGGKCPVLRAGVWKPRSQPGQFEGRGEDALRWLAEVKGKTKLLTAVEVAQPKHVELCMKYNVDILWLGARTSVNPFMVQEIADAIQGTEDIPVMIKNPVCPDLRLWVGAIQRIMRAGTKKIIAIHRGFQSHHKSIYRNIPLWSIPLALKREIPGIPIVCDPSHIAGNKHLLFDVALKALQLEMNGLMIEVHNNPKDALTDPLQQITPKELDQLINSLSKNSQPEDLLLKLDALRFLVDDVDYELLEILAKRQKLIIEIGKIKMAAKKNVLQPMRKENILTDRLNRAKELGLNTLYIENLLQLLHENSIETQMHIINKGK